MSHFISTRNSLQCRSHHQKLEEKYTHVNRIIALFKPHFNKVLYKKFMDQLETMTHEKHLDSLTKYTISDRVMVDQEIQTDIQDIRCDLVEVNPNLVIVHNKKSLGMPGTLSYQHSQQYYPPPIYSPMEAQYQPGPSYPIGHLGWWGGYPARRYWLCLKLYWSFYILIKLILTKFPKKLLRTLYMQIRRSEENADINLS